MMAGAGAPESAIAREIGISPEQMDRGVPEANATDHQDLACLPLGQVVASVRGSTIPSRFACLLRLLCTPYTERSSH